MMGEVLRTLTAEKSMEAKEMPLTPATLARLHRRWCKEGKLNRNTAVEVFAAVFDEDADRGRPM